MASRHWRAGLEELRRDNRSGAAEIGLRAQELLLEAVSDSVPTSLDDYRAWLLRISRDLVAAQPSMATLYRLVNDMLWACHEATQPEEVRLQALSFLVERQERSEEARRALTERAAEYLEPFEAVMTYSRSSTVLATLLALHKRNRRVRVYCGEGRPAYEGQTLAQELGWAGVDVIVGIDMALFGWLREANALVLGADSLSVHGLVNKIGTAALVRAAAEIELPRIVLCSSYKLLPEDFLLEDALRGGDPDEVMPVSTKNVDVRSTYYDITALEPITTVITEHGPQEHSRLQQALHAVRTYPGLRGQ